MHRAVIDYIDEQVANDFADAEARRHRTEEVGHGREEARSCLHMPVPRGPPGLELWAAPKSIGVVSECVRDGEEAAEIRHDVSSLAVGAKRFARAAGGHWGIENGCHRSLDVTSSEDASRIRDEHMRENLAWLRRDCRISPHPDLTVGVGSRARRLGIMPYRI